MNRDKIDQAKADALRFLARVDELERCAGWSRYTATGNEATSTPHPDDWFKWGQYTAAVKRASMDLTRSLANVRK
jgi:hypothetical protein